MRLGVIIVNSFRCIMIKMKKEWLVIVLLVLFTLPTVKSLFQNGAYTSHDLTYHIMRQISMDKLLSEGQIPPRWSGELNQGYGYPVFIFNYQLPALIGEVFHKAGFNFVDSVKAVFALSMFVSVLGMYLFLKELLGSRLSAFLGSIFYLYAPIRFINLYVSASVGAALGASILPFVFYFLVVLSKDNLKNKTFKILLGSLSLSLLILAHNFTTFIFIPVILVFGLYLIFKSKAKAQVFKNFAGMFLLGLGLSAWFFMPAVFEKQYLRFDQFYETFYQNQFISISQLLHSPWGYGLSHPQKPEDGDMSYQLGLIQILVMIILSLWFVVSRKIREIREIGGFSIFFFFLSVFMMTKFSLSVWSFLPFLSIIQFPLRFSIVAVLAASIAAALLVKYSPYKKILFVVLLGLVLYANRNHLNINEIYNPGEQHYLDLQGLTSPYGEDLPKWARPMEKVASSKYQVLRGEGTVHITEDKSHRVVAEVIAETPVTLRFNQFYYPDLQIKVDNNLVSFDYLTEGESYGLPVFEIPKGKHEVLVELKNSLVRNLSDIISLGSMIIWFVLLCRLLTLKKS